MLCGDLNGKEIKNKQTGNVCISSVQFSSVAQSCLTLCNPMNRSTQGLPVHHQLQQFTQTHVHRVRDAIQPSRPLSSPFPPAPNPSQHLSLSSESTLRMRWPEYWSFRFSIIPSKEIPGLILQSMGLSRVFSNTTVQNINSSALSFLHSPTLISIHDHWKNHSLD